MCTVDSLEKDALNVDGSHSEVIGTKKSLEVSHFPIRRYMSIKWEGMMGRVAMLINKKR